MRYIYYLVAMVLLILPITASASYSNDFSSNTMDGFTIVGSFSAASGVAVTSESTVPEEYDSATYLTSGIPQTYWEVKMNSNYICSVGSCGGYQDFRYKGNSTAYHAIRIWTGNTIQIIGEGTYNNVSISNNQSVKITLTQTATNIVVVVYNSSSLAVINTQTIGIGQDIVSDRLVLYSYLRESIAGQSLTSYFDNIVTLETSATTTSIVWGLTSYTVGDSPSFSWTISNADWNSHPFQIYVVRLYKSGIMQDWGTFNWACLCSSQLAVSQTGSYAISADVGGTYLVTLELMTPLIGGNTIVSQSSTSVHVQSSSYFTIPTQANQNTNVSAVYHLGTGGMNGVIQTFWRDENGIEQFEKSFYTIGLDGNINITFKRVGSYNVKLYNYNDGTLLQTKSILIAFVPSTPIGNFVNSSMLLDNDLYNRYDVITGNYTIDAINYTSGTPYLSLYNYNIGVETGRFYTKNGASGMIAAGQIGEFDYGTFDFYIVDSVGENPPKTWIAGNNSMRLMVQNSSSSALTVLAFANFTLLNLDAQGYGLDATPTTVNINTNVRITTTCPTDCLLTVQRPIGGSTAYNISSGTRTVFQAYPTTGKYGLSLMDMGGHVHQTIIITVTSGIVPGTTTPGGISTTGTDISGLLQSKIFWTLVFIVGIMLAISMKERKP